MNHQIIAQHYYAQWLDVPPSRLNDTGVFTVCTQKRNQKLIGYGRTFPLYCYASTNLVILSYSPKIQNQIPILVQALHNELTTKKLMQAITQVFNQKPSRTHKYHFAQLPEPIDTALAVQLQKADYPDFLTFHQTQYPKANPEGWLEDYFLQCVNRGYIFAIYEDGDIVSATDAPDMPYMANQVVEPGIATLASFRRKGHAKTVTAAMIKHLIVNNKTPIWSCAATNIASSCLAESLGFHLCGDVLSLSE